MANLDWTTVRIRTKTRDRINARIAEMIGEYHRGARPEAPVDAGRLSIDALLNWLLDEREKHRQRARRARGAGGPAKTSAGETAPETAGESE